ncbi:MAG: hypothetical protein Q8N31_08625 [Reyranella sp.]|nr:hypothetical protein [Reyranella sp.]
MEAAAVATRNPVSTRCGRFCPIAVKIREGRVAPSRVQAVELALCGRNSL